MTRALVLAAILVPAVLIWTLGHFAAGLIVGSVALAVIWWYGYRAWRADRERRRTYREAVWQRRIEQLRAARPELTIIKGGKEPAWIRRQYP